MTLGRVASARMASACSTVRDAVTAISGTRGTTAMLRGSPGGSTSRSLPIPCEGVHNYKPWIQWRQHTNEQHQQVAADALRGWRSQIQWQQHV